MLATIIIGGIIASFLYAVTSMKSIDFIHRRSQCDSCNENLKWYHLIPVISYIFLKGKCSHCKTKIDLSYPLCELLVIILFVIPLFLGLGLADYTLYYLIVALLIPVSFYDFNTLTIPNHMNLLFLFTGLYLTDLHYIEPIRDIFIVLILHLIYILFSESVGYGDIKLFTVLTLITPINFFIYTILLTYIIGGLFVIFINLYKENINNKIPLVPFIANATVLCFFLYEDFNLIYYGGFL
ncbi:prepilin peptidase [Salinicoccus sp. HZC-1]|uniref:prepilin peptidase n=1 Tax=Salinicoccus sp. HZC-1 TaxID=3385497 RepID=UPI00398A53D1